MTTNRALQLVAFGILCCGAASLLLSFKTIVDIPALNASAESGYAFSTHTLTDPSASVFPGDDNLNPTRSSLQLLENGIAIGPAHSVHEDIRRIGGGRYSHWRGGLLFSTSDNTDPRVNGRTYTAAFTVSLPAWIGYLSLIAGLAILLYSDRNAWAQNLLDSARIVRRHLAWARETAIPAWSLMHLALLAVLLGCSLYLGFERSGWILITQPVEISHSTNSLLGYSFIRDGSVLHKENYSSFLQVAFFSGADVTPDLYFRRPVYTFIATLLAPLFGVSASLFLVNALGWCLAAWLCHKFTRHFYGDEVGARWASLFAITGIGFVVHSLDLSAHLLSFVFYMAGVVLIHESQVWRKTIELRAHLGIAAFLMIACLQYNTGIALVAAYLAVAIRHNRLRYVLTASALALLAQPLWGCIVGWLFEQRHGIALPNLSQTEYEYLQRAISAWMLIFQQPPRELLGSVLELILSFLFFEMPLITIIGGIGLLMDIRNGAEGRARVLFALPFIFFPVLAAMIFSPAHLMADPPAAGARGYLIYGISIFFFASCGAMFARLIRVRRAVLLPLACLVVVFSMAWSTAHFANILGPSKAYFLGMDHASHLFGKGAWEAASLTGNEPTPRIFGGSAPLSEAGLSEVLPATTIRDSTSIEYSLYASGLFASLIAALLVFAARVRWRMALLAASLLLSASALCSRLVDNDIAITTVDRVFRIDPANKVTYEIALSDRVRNKLIAGLREGMVVTLFPGFYTGPVPPEVRIGNRPVPFSRRLNRANWLFDSPELLAGIASTGGGKFEITFAGGDETWVGGWQRNGLPGRRFTSSHSTVQPAILPALEIRLVRDATSLTPLLVGF